MADIGRFNQLEVISIGPYGATLNAGELDDVLLPTSAMPEHCKVGDVINVFIYVDAKQRLTATTQKAKAEVGEVAYLKVLQVNNVGAFLDWGLSKDLLVPYNQQQVEMKVGQSYLVHVFLDEESGRVAASSKLNRFITHETRIYRKGQSVDLFISDKTDLGYSAVINHRHWGLLFFNDVIKSLHIGQRVQGFIKEVRPDGKVTLSLEALGYEKVDSLSTRILKELKNNDGFIPLSDKSPAESINERFSVSKKSYKMTIGALYKKRLITISKEGITLIVNK